MRVFAGSVLVLVLITALLRDYRMANIDESKLESFDEHLREYQDISLSREGELYFDLLMHKRYRRHAVELFDKKKYLLTRLNYDPKSISRFQLQRVAVSGNVEINPGPSTSMESRNKYMQRVQKDDS